MFGLLYALLVQSTEPIMEPLYGPRVAVLYSSAPSGQCAYRDEYDRDFAELGWTAHKFENLQLPQLMEQLSNVDMLVATTSWNEEHWQNLRAYARRLELFVRYGGVVLLTDGRDERQVNWLRPIEPRLDLQLSGEPCPADKDKPLWLDAKHPVLAGLGHLPQPGTHVSHASGRWWVLALCPHERPVLLLRELGDGLIVVTTLSRANGFPNATFLEKLWLWARDPARIKTSREREETYYQAVTEAKVLEAQQISPPTIDGIVEEDAWKKAAQTAEFLTADGTTVAACETRALLGMDRYWLYVAFRCGYDWPPEFEADRVEVLISMGSENAAGFRFLVGVNGKSESDPSTIWWQAAARRDLRMWTAELRIPLVELGGASGLPNNWALSLARYGPGASVGTWARGEGSTGGWGTLKTSAIDAAQFPVRVPRFELLGSQLFVGFTKPSYGEFSGRYVVECASPSGSIRETCREITIPEYREIVVRTEHRMDEPGFWVLRARLEASGGPIWVSPPLVHHAP